MATSDARGAGKYSHGWEVPSLETTVFHGRGIDFGAQLVIAATDLEFFS